MSTFYLNTWDKRQKKKIKFDPKISIKSAIFQCRFSETFSHRNDASVVNAQRKKNKTGQEKGKKRVVDRESERKKSSGTVSKFCLSRMLEQVVALDLQTVFWLFLAKQRP